VLNRTLIRPILKKTPNGDQEQVEVESEVEEAQEDISLPQRLTRSKFKELGSSGRMFSLFVPTRAT